MKNFLLRKLVRHCAHLPYFWVLHKIDITHVKSIGRYIRLGNIVSQRADKLGGAMRLMNIFYIQAIFFL